MTDIDARIERLKSEIAALEKTKSRGYEVEEVSCCGDSSEYDMCDDHDIVWGMDGSLAGIVVNQKIMKKYFADVAVATHIGEAV